LENWHCLMRESFLRYRCVIDIIGHHIIINRQKIAAHPFSKPSNPSKILRFFSKSGVTEIFSSSAVNAVSEAILDILPNHRFHVAENFEPEWMSRRIHDL
jgi:hypothetical protein